MISPERFLNSLQECGVNFFTGVPDSLLKDICACITDKLAEGHIIAANEGNAVALATGVHLATGKVSLVYMQNSGLGNIVNPLLSLTSKDVYKIPMLLMIGWRGEPGVKDEPQHLNQGRVTLKMLEVLDIPYKVIDASCENIDKIIFESVSYCENNNSPYALVIRKGTFSKYDLKKREDKNQTNLMTREEAVRELTSIIPSDNSVILSTTGKISRELYDYRIETTGHCADFLNVGSMGHVSQIALGVALNSKKNIFCYDGDGAALMHLGGMAIIGSQGLINYKHVIFNNGAHDSVGGQPTVCLDIDFKNIASAMSYRKYFKAESLGELKKFAVDFLNENGPVMLEVVVSTGARGDLSRPAKPPAENKKDFIEFLNSSR